MLVFVFKDNYLALVELTFSYHQDKWANPGTSQDTMLCQTSGSIG